MLPCRVAAAAGLSSTRTFALPCSRPWNYAKSSLAPLNLSQEKARLLAGVFGCQIQGMSFTYLGLPMGTTKLRVEHYGPLMNRVERQLTSISSMLIHAGKLQFGNSVISSLLIFFMCSVNVLVAVHEYVGRIVCGTNQRSVVGANPWLHEKNAQDPKEKDG
jgi:hypothetical protein